MRTAKQILDFKGNNVFVIDPETKALDAVKMMNDKRVGALIVVDEDEVEGVFTEQDYLRRVLLKGLDIEETPVAEVMTQNVVTIKPEHTVNDSMQLMTEKHIRHLPVVENKRLVGIISIGDCVKEVISEQEALIGQLEHYIQS